MVRTLALEAPGIVGDTGAVGTGPPVPSPVAWMKHNAPTANTATPGHIAHSRRHSASCPPIYKPYPAVHKGHGELLEDSPKVPKDRPQCVGDTGQAGSHGALGLCLMCGGPLFYGHLHSLREAEVTPERLAAQYCTRTSHQSSLLCWNSQKAKLQFN